MPESCSKCLLSKLSQTGESLICNYSLSTVPWDERPFDCPLVSVSPHGRLIDCDALESLLMKIPDNKCTPKVFASWLTYEENAPTIIPADNQKEE